MPANAIWARWARAAAECSSPWRSFQSFSVTKAMAAFWPLPLNEKPSTPMVFLTSGCAIMNCSICFMASSVRSCEAPGGSWTFTTM